MIELDETPLCCIHTALVWCIIYLFSLVAKCMASHHPNAFPSATSGNVATRQYSTIRASGRSPLRSQDLILIAGTAFM
jgi:hypothetical protein